MEKIASFTIDHTKLVPGVYVSRRDITPNGDILTTFDLRMTAPNREPALTGETIHAIEHLAATYLRNHKEWKDRIVYFGPMGCLTGCYLIVQGKYDSKEIVGLLKETFDFISEYEGEIPGASAKDCGNYKFMNLQGAKESSKRYVEKVLNNPYESQLNYPN